MNAMTIMRRCAAAAGDIQRIEQRIARRREILDISAPQADPNGGSHGGGDKDRIGRVVPEIADLERELAARKEEKEAEEVACCALADMVPELEGRIIFDYYVRRMNTTEIARKEKYQTSYVRRVKRDAEKLVEMISEERVNSTLPAWYLKGKGGAKSGK